MVRVTRETRRQALSLVRGRAVARVALAVLRPLGQVVAVVVLLALLPGRAPSQTAPLQSLTTVKSKPIAVLRVSLSVGSMKAALLLSLTVIKPLWTVGNRR